MRGGWLACVAMAAALAGCGAPDEPSSGGTTSSSWIQTDLAGADLDGDGRTDVVTIATQQQSFGVSEGTLKIYRQTSPGLFLASTIRVGTFPWRLKISDVNGDGAPDLLVLDVIGGAGANDDVLYLLLQDANNRGRYGAPRVVAQGLSANDFVVTDVNLDIAPDIVTAGVPGGGDGAAQYLQERLVRGTFEAPTVLNLAGRVQRVTAGDVGASGRADLVTYSILDTAANANSPGQLVVAYSTLFDAAGTSAFFLTPGRVLASHAGVNAQAIAVADVDGDARADVVTCFTAVSSAFQPKVSVVLQRALDRLEVVDTSLSGLSGLDGFVIADLNGDGRPDVATTGSFTLGTSSTVRGRTNLLAPTIAGRYLQTAAIDMPVPMSRINAVDVDGDTLIDLILLGDSNRAYVMFQSATVRGTFSAPRLL
jgi:FG-GAP-like repeat